MASPAFLGRGIIRPFRRDEKNDFANGDGIVLVTSRVGQVLGTKCTSPSAAGELPWRPEFGSKLYLLRHKNNSSTNQALARAYAMDALARWEPAAIVTGVGVTSDPQDVRRMLVEISFDVIDTNVPGNKVVLPNQSVTIPVLLAA